MEMTRLLPKAGTEEVAALPEPVRVLLDHLASTASVAGIFPPIARPAQDDLIVSEEPGLNPARVDALGAVLGHATFRPVVKTIVALDSWCKTMVEKHAERVKPGVLAITNTDLFGPLLSEIFTVCAFTHAARAASRAAHRRRQLTRALEIFLERLDSDMACSWIDEPAFEGPVTGVSACGAETHNGGSRVLRVTLQGGAVVAYKPSPARGDALFSARHSLGDEPSTFGLINDLADGRFRLPQLHCWRGAGYDSHDYLWQEWVSAPAQMAPLTPRLSGPVVEPDVAAEMWRDAGALAAVCFAFGIGDLIEGNVLVGPNGPDGRLRYVPVDIEVYFSDIQRLWGTGLIPGPDDALHHVGFEDRQRECGVDAPWAYLDFDGDDAPRICRIRKPWARGETRTVVTDSNGNVGYSAYLPQFLRGAFEAWVLLNGQRDRIARNLAAHRRDNRIRVVPRPTAVYDDELQRRLFTPDKSPELEFTKDEQNQLHNGDVPYFFVSAQGGSLLKQATRGDTTTRFRVAGDDVPRPCVIPSEDALHGRAWDMTGFGVFVRDAVEYARANVPVAAWADHDEDVSIDLWDIACGQVRFGFSEFGQDLNYCWNDDTVNLEPMEPQDRPHHEVGDYAEVAEKLARIGDVDGAIREPWAQGGFSDDEAAAKLERLTRSATDYLTDVVAVHGWPSADKVGRAAAESAVALLQHRHGATTPFQRHCLALLRDEARRDRQLLKMVAYLTDAMRLQDDRPQRYGTKFERDGDALVPCQLDGSADDVEKRREEIGMVSLTEYAQILHNRFPLSKAVNT